MSVDQANILARSAAHARVANGIGSGRAFVIEAMLLLAFLGLAIALTVQLFATSSLISQTAHDSTVNQMLATRAAETAAAQDNETSAIAYFDKNAQECEKDEAAYAVETLCTSVPAGAGDMLEIRVYAHALSGNKDSSFTVETKRYRGQGAHA